MNPFHPALGTRAVAPPTTLLHRGLLSALTFALVLTASATLIAQPAPAKRPENRVPTAAAAAAPANTAPTGADRSGAETTDGDVAKPVVEASSAPPKPGHVVITADAEGLVAELNGAMHGLKVGENRIEVPAGDWKVVVRGKDGVNVGDWTVHVDAEGEGRVDVVTIGHLVVPVVPGRVVEIAGEAVEATDGSVDAKLPAGTVSVVVKQFGMTGIKGDVAIVAGKTATIDPQLAAFSGGNKNIALGAIIGGGAMVLGGVLMEALADADAAGGDITRWALVGVGTAAFVVGTIRMKSILELENNPPVQDGTFDVRLSAGRRGGMASFAMRF